MLIHNFGPLWGTWLGEVIDGAFGLIVIFTFLHYARRSYKNREK